jgi:hypothetical protein
MESKSKPQDSQRSFPVFTRLPHLGHGLLFARRTSQITSSRIASTTKNAITNDAICALESPDPGSRYAITPGKVTTRPPWRAGCYQFDPRRIRAALSEPGNNTMKRTITLVVLIALATVALPATAWADPMPANRHFDNYFLTPSGKTVCNYDGFAGRYHVSCAVGGGYGSTSYGVHPRGRAYKRMVTGDLGQIRQLAPRGRYGRTYRYHGITCRIHKTRGIRCINRSQHGFRVSVEHQRRF